MSPHLKQNFLLCKLVVLLGFSILSSTQVGAQTNSITVNFTGEVIASNCKLAAGATAVTVPLPQIKLSDALATPVQNAIPGSTNDIDVNLTDCPRRVTIQFSGTQSADSFNRLVIPDVNGGVRGFAIAPRFNTVYVGPTTARSLDAAADGSLTFKIGGSLLRTVENASGVVPGSVAASMTLTFIPQ